MTKEFKTFFLLCFLFFFIGLFLQFFLFERIKSEFIANNAAVVGTILEKYPSLEKDIVLTLQNVEQTDYGNRVLSKYGLNSLSSLDYLTSIQNYRITFFGVYCFFFGLVILFFCLYFYMVQRRRKQELAKVDRYLFSLLSDQIQVDLKDFQSGELKSLQNDLMKVTSRLRSSLESSTSSKLELAKTLADISHQLKTPLTSMIIVNEALANFEIDDQTRNEFLIRQRETLEHMKSLIVTLLKVSQIESGMIELKKDKVDIKEIVLKVYEQLELIMVAKNIKVQLNLEECYLLGDSYWLGEAILNVLKNAYEHSFEEGIVDVKLKSNPMFVELIIEDYGEGIEPKDLPHIFERFYKSSRTSDSIGIGLNLTKSILERSNASISATSGQGKTTFTMRFYKTIV